MFYDVILFFNFIAPEYDLLVANGDSLFFVHYEGANSKNLRFDSSQTVQGVDIHLK